MFFYNCLCIIRAQSVCVMKQQQKGITFSLHLAIKGALYLLNRFNVVFCRNLCSQKTKNLYQKALLRGLQNTGLFIFRLRSLTALTIYEELEAHDINTSTVVPPPPISLFRNSPFAVFELSFVIHCAVLLCPSACKCTWQHLQFWTVAMRNITFCDMTL